MKSYSTYIFDWDGCLAKTLDIWLEGYRQQGLALGYDFTDSQITSIFGDWHGPSKLGIVDEKKFFSDMEPFLNDQMTKVALYPGVKQTLLALKEKSHHLALLTSSIMNQVGPALELHQLSKLFNPIITGLDVTHHKPHPEGIFKILSTLNADPATAIMVGDSDKDIQAAHQAGIDSALFYPPEHELFYSLKELQMANPTYTINSIVKLIT
jgi:HAD superfamily hydrolase (TIGR01509 family)